MPPAHLPPDSERELDFEDLIATLRALEDETVVVAVDPRRMDPALVVLEGTLRSLRGDDGRSADFQVGSEGRLSLDPRSFSEASLHTHDGNEFFSIEIVLLHGTRLIIGDPETT